jgi:6-phosphogluconolactonase
VRARQVNDRLALPRAIRYAGRMQLEVYESDGEALEAAAALAEALLAELADGTPSVGIAGGRGGRAIMLALSGRSGIPWKRARFCVADECAAPGEEPTSTQLLRDHLLVPHGVTGAPATDGEPAAAWEETVRATAGPATAFDLLVLDLGGRGEIGALDAEALAASGDGAVIVRGAARIGLGPAALRAARRVILVATGAQRSQALATAMRPSTGTLLPAHLVLPSARATWFVDRAAAVELLRDAQPAPA